MTYCLVDELTGCNEHWTVNASDVLSFARQVAVAMVGTTSVMPFTSYISCTLLEVWLNTELPNRALVRRRYLPAYSKEPRIFA